MPRIDARRRRTVWLLSVAACLVAAAVGWVVWGNSRLHETTVPGDVLMSGDGRTLTTPVDWTDCEDKPQLAAEETAHTVKLTLTRKRHSFLSRDTVCDDRHDGLVTTTLSEPVGNRKMTDAVTGSVVIPFDASHLERPRYLPPGYAPADNVIAPGNRSDPPYTRARTPSWTTTYQRNRDKGGQAGYVSITEEPGGIPQTHGTAISLNGRPAHLQERPGGSRSATWADKGYAVTVEAGDPLMARDEFLRIAEEIHR
ncbi:hypothetical protein [Streptomyces bugieae]|uniref:Tat pathway signal sequence domain protein n=1 Tax=Streptomyces bugieae TaxID=3098223 RepID=A0ABU7P456_9ACTN|nr:hypothetical protein [Streptomyces sp. DSM 41528]